MKTIVCHKVNEFRLIEAQKPIPKAGESLIRIRRIGICGTDYHAFKGNQPYFSYPRVLGHELAGTIEEINGESHGLSVGMQVTVLPYIECGTCVACRVGKTNCCANLAVLGVHIDGGMQEWFTVPTDHLVSTEGLSLDQSAIIEPLSIGAHAVSRSELKADEVALVIGTGPIGLGVIAFALQRGAKVIAMDVSEERLDFCSSWAKVDGVVHALHDSMEELKSITGGDLPSVVFDATGNAGSMEKAFSYAAHGGRVIYVGLTTSEIKFSHPEFHRKELTLLGSRNATRENVDEVLAAIRNGKINTDKYITHRASFEEMIGQFDHWMNPANGVIKALVEL